MKTQRKIQNSRFEIYEVVHTGKLFNLKALKLRQLLIKKYGARRVFGKPYRIKFPTREKFPDEYLKDFKKIEQKDDS